MKTLAIAMLGHAMNAAYCQSLGDDSQLPWDDTPETHKQSLIAGVEMHLANPNATPEQSHQSWYAQKEAEGWAYGEFKDLEKYLSEIGIENNPEKLYGDIFKERTKEPEFNEILNNAINDFLMKNK